MPTKVKIHGSCGHRFKSVKEAFTQSIEEKKEVGASFAVMIDGEYVIDIYGGYKDTEKTQPWENDTICNVFSTTKVPTALCTMMCVDRDLLDLDEKVSKYWPEFAQGGKENISVRHILSHSSGLAGIDEPIPWSAWYDWNRIIKLLEVQKPWWEPGTKSGYHGFTQGYLLGELVKRVTGKSLGTFFKEEIANPLNIDFYIGLPEDQIPCVSNLIPARSSGEEISLIFGYITEIANKSERIKKEIEKLEKYIEFEFVDQEIFGMTISNNKITIDNKKLEKSPDYKFTIAKETSAIILSLFSPFNNEAEIVSSNMKVEGDSEDIKLIKKLFEIIANEVRTSGSLVLRQLLNPINYVDISIRSSERLWQNSEIPAANGHGNARSVAKIASIIACGGEINNIRLLSAETIEKMLEEQIYDTDLIVLVPIRWGLGVALSGKIISFPNDRTCFWQGAGGSGIIMDLDNKIGIGYVMNQMRNQPLSETLSNKFLSDTRGNRLVTAVYESLGLI